MFKLYKNGDFVVNNATFDYICDNEEDLNKIPKNKINLGSTAVVIDKDNGIRVYISDSKDNWTEITDDLDEAIGGGSGSSFELTKEKINAALGIDVKAQISAASVKISGVEESVNNHENRITALESSSGSGSGSGSSSFSTNNYELINEIVTDGSYNAISLTKDDDGNDYNLQAVYIEFTIGKPTGTASIRTYANDILTTVITNGLPTTSTLSKPFKSSTKINIEGGMLNGVSIMPYQADGNVQLQNYTQLLKGNNISSINKIDITSSSSIKFPNASVIKIYGIKR